LLDAIKKSLIDDREAQHRDLRKGAQDSAVGPHKHESDDAAHALSGIEA